MSILIKSADGRLSILAALLILGLGAIAVGAQTPAVATDHAAYFPGEDIVASFKGGPGNRKDWVGIYPEDVEPGPVASTRWLYVDNTPIGTVGYTEGSLTFGGGLNLAGPWNIYLLLDDGYTKLATNTFTIVDPAAPIVRTDKRVYAPGAAITVFFTNGPANDKDWIGIYKEGQTPGGPQSTIWNYVDGTQTGNTRKPNGTITFASGLPTTGNYVAHFLENDGYTILASETFSVAELASSTPRLLSIQPGNNASNLPPVVAFVAAITNGATKVVSESVALQIDGVTVPQRFSQQDELVTIAYTNEVLYAPQSAHTATLTYADTATPANRFTNDITFTVAAYRNVVLPAPLFFENFDTTSEGQLPAGWTETSFTEAQNADLDFGNLDSAAYAKWTVVNAERFRGTFVTYSNPDNSQAEKEDYRRVLTVNPLNVVNGKVLNEPLAQGRFLFGNSGYRNGQSQVLFVFTPDFDLSGKTNIHLSYHSLWEQNQDSIGAVEYSVDQGRNWLPVVYMIDGADILMLTNDTTGAVSIDALATLNAEQGDVARYMDENGVDQGGTYGAFIAAPISQDLAPFISGRVNDDPVESKRVEFFRLPQADNQAKVRFRFAHAGTDSWYFGVDNFGLYAIVGAPVSAPTLAILKTGNQITISWPAQFTGFTLESTPSLTNPSWTAVAGVVNNAATITPTANAQFYRLR